MKVLIIEDEYPAAERLTELILSLDDSLEIEAVLDSIESASNWLETHRPPALIFSDIQLSDGLSFEIFNQTRVQSPIIFTTAYDEYAIQAFKVKSIDYLLKPIKFQELSDAVQKYYRMQQEFSPVDLHEKVTSILSQFQATPSSYKKRFLVSGKDELIPISIDKIAYFFTRHEVVYLMTVEGNKFALDYTLDQLSNILHPDVFFRINRQMICHIQAIKSIHPYFNGRLKLHLTPSVNDQMIVSRDKAKIFKSWLDGEQS